MTVSQIKGVTTTARRLDDEEWRAVLDAIGEHSFFATPRWGAMVRDAGLGYRCGAFSIAVDGIQVVLPYAESRRFGFTFRESMPFGTYGGALLTHGESTGNRKYLADAVTRYLLSDWRLASFSASPGPHQHLALGVPAAEHETDILDLKRGADALWKDLDKDARNQVRQAERAGVAVSFDNSEEGFRTYYSMLEASARRWGIDSPAHPWSLFASISRHASDATVRLWVATVEGEPAAAALCFYGAGEVFYWSGAMHERFARARPNNLLQWRVIEDAASRGFTEYNMGASGELGGVRKFKQQFGARSCTYPTYVIRGQFWNAARTIARRRRA